MGETGVGLGGGGEGEGGGGGWALCLGEKERRRLKTKSMASENGGIGSVRVVKSMAVASPWRSVRFAHSVVGWCWTRGHGEGCDESLVSLRSERAITYVLTLPRSMYRMQRGVDAVHVLRLTVCQLDGSAPDVNACSHGVPARRSLSSRQGFVSPSRAGHQSEENCRRFWWSRSIMVRLPVSGLCNLHFPK